MVDKNEIKKDLYKSKNFAIFSHYQSGNLYYTVEINDGKYQFPISTIEVETETLYVVDETIESVEIDDPKTYLVLQKDVYNLSFDLGSTPFGAEVKGSELIRWIQKAIDAGEFIKVG